MLQHLSLEKTNEKVAISKSDRLKPPLSFTAFAFRIICISSMWGATLTDAGKEKKGILFPFQHHRLEPASSRPQSTDTQSCYL